ncbi:hypothetical protein OFN63_34125, partial [Escherichia coli]|nr:hypothetical protein [Escherichia coli]
PVTAWLLSLLNALMASGPAVQDSLVCIGVLPAVLQFAAPAHALPVRAQVAAFVDVLLAGPRHLRQVFIACGGINVLVGLLFPSKKPG